MNFGNDSEQIKSWKYNDNTAYRLGDVVLHAGKYFDDLKSCILALHNNTLAARYLQHPQYYPAIAKNKIRNMEVFNEVLLQSCPALLKANPLLRDMSWSNLVVVHLRLGDGVYSDHRVAVLRTPYPIRCYEELLRNYSTTNYKIGLIHNNTASSIFSSSSSFSNNLHLVDSKLHTSTDRVTQYLHKLKSLFPNAYDVAPYASPDEHFCVMVNAPLLLVGKGNTTYTSHCAQELRRV